LLAVTSEGSAENTVGRAFSALVVSWIVESILTFSKRNTLIDAILDNHRLSAITGANSKVLVVEIERESASIAFSEGSFACSAVLWTFLTIVLSVGILTNLAGGKTNTYTVDQVLIIIATTSLLFSCVLDCE